MDIMLVSFHFDIDNYYETNKSHSNAYYCACMLIGNADISGNISYMLNSRCTIDLYLP